MPVLIEGRYALIKSENFDEYLKSCGVNFILRSIANKFKPELEITCDEDGVYMYKTETPLKTIIVRFKLGENYEIDFPDNSGRKMQAFAELDGNKLKTVQTLDGCTIVDEKEFSNEGLVTTLTHSAGVTCVRTYRRIE